VSTHKINLLSMSSKLLKLRLLLACDCDDDDEVDMCTDVLIDR
jgi:hypothetical protein